jgi:hypothetical protein
MFLDVSFYWKEVLVDERGGLRVFVRLGIQPSARSSCRRCAEIQQNRTPLLFRSSQGLVNIFAPVNGHIHLLTRNRLLDERAQERM